MPHGTAIQTTHSQTSTRVESTTDQEGRASMCCGGPAPSGTDACCARDAEAKSAGDNGCGCGSTAPAPTTRKTACCG
jgi:hypothetical protein